jgi:hypothetical protein
MAARTEGAAGSQLRSHHGAPGVASAGLVDRFFAQASDPRGHVVATSQESPASEMAPSRRPTALALPFLGRLADGGRGCRLALRSEGPDALARDGAGRRISVPVQRLQLQRLPHARRGAGGLSGLRRAPERRASPRQGPGRQGLRVAALSLADQRAPRTREALRRPRQGSARSTLGERASGYPGHMLKGEWRSAAEAGVTREVRSCHEPSFARLLSVISRQ